MLGLGPFVCLKSCKKSQICCISRVDKMQTEQMAAALRKSNISNIYFPLEICFIACLNGPGCKAHSAVGFYYLKYCCSTQHVACYQEDHTNLTTIGNISSEAWLYLYSLTYLPGAGGGEGGREIFFSGILGRIRNFFWEILSLGGLFFSFVNKNLGRIRFSWQNIYRCSEGNLGNSGKGPFNSPRRKSRSPQPQTFKNMAFRFCFTFLFVQFRC